MLCLPEKVCFVLLFCAGGKLYFLFLMLNPAAKIQSVMNLSILHCGIKMFAHH